MLSQIPGGRLRKGAPARSWLAMRYFIGRRTKGKVWLMPTGPSSSYRPYAKQVEFYELYTSGRGPLAARPGTSNHGWGLAVDCGNSEYQRSIRTVGHLFGWGIQGGRLSSDAMSESWHTTFRGANGRGQGMTWKARLWYARYRAAQARKRKK